MVNLKNYTREELYALAAANAPNPSRELIDQWHRNDMQKNPYGEADKPPIRNEIQIVADYKLDFAEELLKRMDTRKFRLKQA